MKPTVILALSAGDEFRVCVRCRAGLRYWMLASFLRQPTLDLPRRVVMELDPNSPLRDLLGQSGRYLRTYWSPADAPGSVRPDGARCEDITALTLPDDSLDLIVSSEVLEHVPDLDAAMGETQRVLKPGGFHLFTVPARTRTTRRRAVVRDDGRIEHILPPQYHSDPRDPDGILAFWEIGTEDGAKHLSRPGLRVEIVDGPTGRDGRVIWRASRVEQPEVV
jgi:SAM-dependent methyltransferase